MARNGRDKTMSQEKEKAAGRHLTAAAKKRSGQNKEGKDKYQRHAMFAH